MQANVELQKAAQKVIEENILLRKILGELGLETAHVDKRIQELKVAAIADGNDFNICGGDHGCGEASGSGLDGVGRDMAASLDSAQSSSEQSLEPAVVGNRQGSVTGPVNPSSMDADTPQANINGSPLLSAFHNPIFDTSLLEAVPDQESLFDITRFLEPVMHIPSDTLHLPLVINKYYVPQFSPSPPNSFIVPTPIDQGVSQSLDLSIATPHPSTPSPAILPQDCCSTSCIPTTKSTTPCTDS